MSASTRSGTAIFFVIGIPALFRAWAQRNEDPLSGWFYASAVSGVVLVGLGVFSIWVQRRSEVAPERVTPP